MQSTGKLTYLAFDGWPLQVASGYRTLLGDKVSLKFSCGTLGRYVDPLDDTLLNMEYEVEEFPTRFSGLFKIVNTDKIMWNLLSVNEDENND